MSALTFAGRTVIVTGGGGALGRAYALEFAKRGANVVVNDLRGDLTTSGAVSQAQKVVDEITSGGGKAIANYDNVVNSPRSIVDHALKIYKSCDVVVNNAGILRDKSFGKTLPADWQSVLDVHLHGTHGLCREAWSHMVEKKFGRIVNIGSGAGLYGNFGQASYSAAKMGIVGFTQTLAQEGAKHNILANVVVPIAESRMTATVLPSQMLALLAPEHIAPLVTYLSHDSCNISGKIFECGGGWYSQVRWQRSGGKALGRQGAPASAETIGRNMADIQDFSLDRASYPAAAADALRDMIAAATSLGNVQLSQEPNSKATESSATAEVATPLVKLESDRVFSKLSAHINVNAGDISSQVGKRAVQFTISGKVWILDCTNPEKPTIDAFSSLKLAHEARAGKVPIAVNVSLSDEHFLKLCSGDLSAEWAYATGKMKVEGSMGSALKLKGLLALAGKLNKG